MDVTPQELRGSEIKDSWRGYDRDEVDDLLERAAVTIEGLTQRLQDAASRPAPVAGRPAPESVPLPSSRDDADMLQRTLLLAQRAADDAVNEAQARARQMLDESEAKAQALVSDAEASARRIAEGERRRLEGEILELSSRREKLRSDADALDEYAAGYRDRLRAAIAADLAKLDGDVEPPQPRPELHDVTVPPVHEPVREAWSPEPTFAADDAIAPVPGPPPTDLGDDNLGSWDAGSDTGTAGAQEGAPTGAGGASPFASAGSPSPVSAPPRPTAEWPPPAPAAGSATAGTVDSSWLAEADDWAAADQAWQAPAPWERDAAQDAAHDDTAPPAAFASEVPMDANPVDTDSLDDDAFFASLREAVRDDTPLGANDDDQSGFFEGEGDHDRRRFRRRR
ncbi:MAG: DivIVA domain-containing protein [Acidimicrobiia bacterium]